LPQQDKRSVEYNHPGVYTRTLRRVFVMQATSYNRALFIFRVIPNRKLREV